MTIIIAASLVVQGNAFPILCGGGRVGTTSYRTIVASASQGSQALTGKGGYIFNSKRHHRPCDVLITRVTHSNWSQSLSLKQLRERVGVVMWG